eukprot:UN13090
MANTPSPKLILVIQICYDILVAVVIIIFVKAFITCIDSCYLYKNKVKERTNGICVVDYSSRKWANRNLLVQFVVPHRYSPKYLWIQKQFKFPRHMAHLLRNICPGDKVVVLGNKEFNDLEILLPSS